MFRKALTALALTLALAAGSVGSASASLIDNVPPIFVTLYGFVSAQDVTGEEGIANTNRDGATPGGTGGANRWSSLA